MKWRGRRASTNVEDRRGMSGPVIAGGGIGGIILVLIITFLGGDPSEVLNNMQSGTNEPYVETEEDKELAEFVSVVLGDTETVWHEIFQEEGKEYREPTLVLFSGGVQTACGGATAAVGPFYCPGDEKLYIDLSFYKELQNRFHAPGDFAMAYVVAHEVGHHVQTQLGISQQMADLRQRLSEKEYNKYQVRMELQADYLAGVWANHAQGMGLLEKGDLEEALNAAFQIGDDTLQKQAQGYVVPDSFTHGTSEQRKKWFYRGFQYGDLEHGDTFNTNDL